MKTITVGYEFRVKDPVRGLRWYAELLKMELDARRFEAQLREFQRAANMGRDELEEMARKAKRAGQ